MTHRFAHLRASPANRGYGARHRKERQAALPHYLNTRCPGLPADALHPPHPCGRLFTHSRMMHWDHDDNAPASRGHSGKRFLCASCNTRKAARKGNRTQARNRIIRARRIKPLSL